MTAATATKVEVLDFPAEIRRRFRVRREFLGPKEWDVTIPLRGKRGFVYVYGSGWYGVWLNTGFPNRSLDRLRPEFPRLIVQQIGVGECTSGFRVTTWNGYASGWVPAVGAKCRKPSVGDWPRVGNLTVSTAYRVPWSVRNRRNGPDRWFDAPGDKRRGVNAWYNGLAPGRTRGRGAYEGVRTKGIATSYTLGRPPGVRVVTVPPSSHKKPGRRVTRSGTCPWGTDQTAPARDSLTDVKHRYQADIPTSKRLSKRF